MKPITNRQAFIHPDTNATAQVTFDGTTTVVIQEGTSTEFPPPPWNEAEAIAAARQSMGPMYVWSVNNVHTWRQQLVGMYSNDLAGAKAEAIENGFPAQLWDDIDNYERALGYTDSPNPNEPLQGPANGYGVTIVERGQPDPVTMEGFKVFRVDDPSLQNSLLFNPTPELKAKFEDRINELEVGVSPPPPDTVFGEKTRALRDAGFIRRSVIEADGRAWLPEALESYRQQLDRSRKQLVRVGASRATANLWDSKVGGVPYRAKGQAWPTWSDDASYPLGFLAQFNLGQLNGDAVVPYLPTKGMLQFFVFNTMFYGMPDDNMGTLKPVSEQKQYRVLYIAAITEDVSALDTSVPAILPSPDQCSFPHDPTKEVTLARFVDNEAVSWCAFETATVFGVDLMDFGNPAAEVIRSPLSDDSVHGHKLGGYPNFTQSYTRPDDDDSILLAQFDSDSHLHMMWGDVGIANFFIRPAELAALDFTKVTFHWDCG